VSASVYWINIVDKTAISVRQFLLLSSNHNHCRIEYWFKDTLWNHRCTIELNRLWNNSTPNTLIRSSISLHTNEMMCGYFIAVSVHM
jgi:hypothetical protein